MDRNIKQCLVFVVFGIAAVIFGLILLNTAILRKRDPGGPRDRSTTAAIPSPRDVVKLPPVFGNKMDRTVVVIYDVSGQMGAGSMGEISSLSEFLEDILFRTDSIPSRFHGLQTDTNNFNSFANASLPLISEKGKTNVILGLCGISESTLQRQKQRPNNREHWLNNFSESLFQSGFWSWVLDANNRPSISSVLSNHLPKSPLTFDRYTLSFMDIAPALAFLEIPSNTFCTEYLLVVISSHDVRSNLGGSTKQEVYSFIPYPDLYQDAAKAFQGGQFRSSTIYEGRQLRGNGDVCYCRISEISPSAIVDLGANQGNISAGAAWHFDGDLAKIQGKTLDLQSFTSRGHIQVLDLLLDGWVSLDAQRWYVGPVLQDRQGLSFPRNKIPNPSVRSAFTIRTTATGYYDSGPPLNISLPLMRSWETPTVVPAQSLSPLAGMGMVVAVASLLILGGLSLYLGVGLLLSLRREPLLEVVSATDFTVYSGESDVKRVTYRVNVHLTAGTPRKLQVGLRNVGGGVVKIRRVFLEGLDENPYLTARLIDYSSEIKPRTGWINYSADSKPKDDGMVLLELSPTQTQLPENPTNFSIVIILATSPEEHRIEVRVIYHQQSCRLLHDWVGIDLGTFGCSAAIYSLEFDQNARSLLELAPVKFENNYEGYQANDRTVGNRYVLPSVVNVHSYCTEENGRISVGNDAIGLSDSKPEYTFHAVKILVDRNKPFGQFNDKVDLIHVLRAQIDPILDQIKNQTGCDQINRVVLTVPNIVSYKRTKLLFNLAYQCGFEEVRLIEEACAMAMTHHQLLPILGSQMPTGRNILYVDMGGGTTDLALIEVKKSSKGISYPVRDSATIYMGGEDIDYDIAEYLCECLLNANPSKRDALKKYTDQIKSKKEDLIAPLPKIEAIRSTVKYSAKEVYKHNFDDGAFKVDGTSLNPFNIPLLLDMDVLGANVEKTGLTTWLSRDHGVIMEITNQILAQIRSMTARRKVEQIVFTGRALNFNPLWDYIFTSLHNAYSLVRLSENPLLIEITQSRQITKLGVSIGAARIGRLTVGGHEGKMLLIGAEKKATLTWGIRQPNVLGTGLIFTPIIKKGDRLEGWYAAGERELIADQDVRFQIGYVQKRIERETPVDQLPGNRAYFENEIQPEDRHLKRGRRRVLIKLRVDERNLRPTLKAYFTAPELRQGLKSWFSNFLGDRAFPSAANIPPDQDLDKQTLILKEDRSWRTTWPN